MVNLVSVEARWLILVFVLPRYPACRDGYIISAPDSPRLHLKLCIWQLWCGYVCMYVCIPCLCEFSEITDNKYNMNNNVTSLRVFKVEN